MAESFGIEFLINPDFTTMDVSDATVSKDFLNNLNNLSGDVNFDIITSSVNIGHLTEGDTIPWNTAFGTFNFEETTPYFQGTNAFIQTTMPPSYPEPYINAILQNKSKNYPEVTFLFTDGTIIPESYYSVGK